MRARVVLLYHQGVRRPRDELRADPGIFGDLAVFDRIEVNAEKRSLKMADLLDPEHCSASYPPRPLLVPLFDVVLLRITAKGMLLRGFQCSSSKDLIVTHYIQEWWCQVL